jgi:transposase-like protein
LTTLELIKMYSSNGFTVRQISDKLSELEISVSKSTVSKWMNKYIKKSKLTA